MSDPIQFDFQHFIDAQDAVIDQAQEELRVGRKRSHWMWFVFPQIAGLGFSAMSQRYAIGSREEAKAYLEHAILGSRLEASTQLVIAHHEKSAHEIFDSPDDLKFQSCMTLFDVVSPDSWFAEALKIFFQGGRDAATLEKLG